MTMHVSMTLYFDLFILTLGYCGIIYANVRNVTLNVLATVPHTFAVAILLILRVFAHYPEASPSLQKKDHVTCA